MEACNQAFPVSPLGIQEEEPWMTSLHPVHRPGCIRDSRRLVRCSCSVRQTMMNPSLSSALSGNQDMLLSLLRLSLSVSSSA